MVTRYELQEEVPVVAEGQPYETPDTLRRGAILVSEADYDALQQAHDRLKGAAREAATALMEIQYQVGLGGISNTKVRVHTLAKDAVKALAEAGIQGGTT